MRGEGGVAGEESVGGVPKFHSWDKCTMPLMNINSDWMSNASSGLSLYYIILYYIILYYIILYYIILYYIILYYIKQVLYFASWGVMTYHFDWLHNFIMPIMFDPPF